MTLGRAVEAIDLERRFVLLSASFPSGLRAEGFPPARQAEIADAVVAIARAVFAGNGRLVFGGHPTITPLVLMVASEAEYGRATETPEDGHLVVVYQSRLFAPLVTDETLSLERLGRGTIRWTDADEGESPTGDLRHLRSLDILRRAMVEETRPIAAFFVGGMEGVVDELELLRSLLPTVLAFPLGAAGGAAGMLAAQGDIPEALSTRLHGSHRYPAVVHEALSLVSRRL